MAKKRPVEQSAQLQDYLGSIRAYEREFKKWETRVDRILKRYRDEDRPSNKSSIARFNILWSNVQTLVPATFSRLPQPDVSRRFRDNDPIGRVAALLLERGLDFEVQHYADYRYAMRACVYDRFLGGRGTAWARYEPHFRTKAGQPDDGSQITEDTDEAPVDEQLDYECAPIDYVHWRDFGHDVARTWEEVTRVWRKVYMSEESVAERFGEDVAKKIPYDSTPEELKRAGTYKAGDEGIKKQACVYELWDKAKGVAVWFSKSMTEVLDERPDPLGLQEFFPCPRPLYATLTNDSLIPTPDFSLYQDQAKELDTLSDRIDGLVDMLQLKGVYDASADASLARLFTEGQNGTLLPVKNWAQFAEKNGLKGQVDVYDITPIAQALKIASESMEQVKSQVYEITGISDIIRGQTQASETATAQQIKGQYASLRLRSMQDEVAQFATDVLRLKAQIMCSKFAPQTLAAIAAVEQLTEEDKALVPQAMALLIGAERMQNPDAESPNPLRSFRIDIAADTLVQLDEQREKQDRMEMLTAFGQYLEKAAQVGAVAPQMVPLLVEVGKFGLTSFKVGKQIEGTFDQALEALKAQAVAPQMDPAAMQEQAMQAAKAQVAQENATKEIALNKKAADLDLREAKYEAMKQVDDIKRQAEDQKRAQEAQSREHEIGMAAKDLDHRKATVEHETKMKSERAAFDEERSRYATETHDKVQRETETRDQALVQLVQEVSKQNAETQAALAALVKAVGGKKRIVRDGKTGRALGVEPVE